MIVSGKFRFIRILLRKWRLFLLAAVVIPYSFGIWGDFVYDDVALIKTDPFYTQEKNPLECWNRSYWKESRRQGLYRPVTVFTYWINAALHGMRSQWFRITNLAIHMLAVFLVFRLSLLLKFGRTASFLSALIFAIHPIHTEAVIPSFGRAELLCAAFLTSGFIMHIKSLVSRRWIIGAFFCALLALWSKEHAVIFLPICILIDLFSGQNTRTNFKDLKKLLASLGAYAVYLTAYLIAAGSRYYVLGSLIPEKSLSFPEIDNRLALCSAGTRIISAVSIQGKALIKFLWPSTLSHDYSYAEIIPVSTLLDPFAVAALIFLIGLPILLCYLYRKNAGIIIFLTLAYIVSIIPAGNFIIPSGTIFAERLQYTPSIWLSLSFGAAWICLSRKLPFKTGLCCIAVIILALMFRTSLRCPDWDNNRTLSLVGMATSPGNAKNWVNLAVVYEKDGDFRSALDACNRALSIYPDFAMAMMHRGMNYSRLGMRDQAEMDLRDAVLLKGRSPYPLFNLGVFLAHTGRKQEALEVWERALKKYPKNEEIRLDIDRLKKNYMDK